ncbi:MAG: HmuY family protein [Gemmatimonadota bacterium]
MAGRSFPAWLSLLSAAFVLLIIVIVVGSLRRAEPRTFLLSQLSETGLGTEASLAGPTVVSLDARSPDRWTWFDFSRAASPSVPGPMEWDLGVRRFQLLVNGGPGFSGNGGVMVVQEGFGELAEAPGGEYEVSRVSPGGDSLSTGFDDWYEYGFFSHLLEPLDATYVLRTAEGHYVKLRILSYYCPGPEPGCLTIEYTYQGNGSRQLR